MNRFIFGLSVLFHRSICPCLERHHTVLMPVTFNKFCNQECAPLPFLVLFSILPSVRLSSCAFFFTKIVYFGCAGLSLLLGLCSSYGECGLLSSWASRSGAQALGSWASVAAACGLSSCGSWALAHRLSTRVSRAQLLCSMWDLPGSRIEPVSSALAGGFFIIGPPGRPSLVNSLEQVLTSVFRKGLSSTREDHAAYHQPGKKPEFKIRRAVSTECYRPECNHRQSGTISAALRCQRTVVCEAKGSCIAGYLCGKEKNFPLPCRLFCLV